ncbi:MAG: hypothetical protein H6813_07360 [Phycisphaeraceae bacterium]|nr:hypothetical protein [Phycisphaeraceae bacterium]MCB9848313.1 hypothetical protein [Phycisphaeraceae bacterium]
MQPVLRPAFTQPLPMPIDEAMARIDAVREIGGQPVVVEAAGRGRHRMIALHPSLRHTWSPWAHLDLRESDQSIAEERDAGCVVVLRFSPNPPLWFAIMFSYLALGTIAVFALCWGVAQWTIRQPPHALWIVPACALLGLAIVAAARLGQSLAREQMLLMRAALRSALGIESVPPDAA